MNIVIILTLSDTITGNRILHTMTNNILNSRFMPGMLL